MKTLHAKITRASRGEREGFSLWVYEKPMYAQSQTLDAINNRFNKDYLTGAKNPFNIVIQMGHSTYRFAGHCNISRGDFYINKKHWNEINGLFFTLGNSVFCDVINVDNI